jgi:hypothetical protein
MVERLDQRRLGGHAEGIGDAPHLSRSLPMIRVVVAMSVLAGMTIAADPPLQGTEPGNVLPGPFSAYVVFGGVKPEPKEPVQTEERQNFGDPTRLYKHSDLVTRFGLDPTVAVFTREAAPSDDSALVKLLKQLDDSVQKYQARRLRAFAVFLRLKDDFLKDDDRIPQARSIEQFAAKSAIKQTPLALDQAESDRTKKWNIGPDDQVVVIVYENHKVRAKFAFTAEKPLDDAGVQAVMAEVQKIVKK